MQPAVLVVNAGSSSHKCKLFSAKSDAPDLLWEGTLDWFPDVGQVEMYARNGQGSPITQRLSAAGENPLKALLATINFPYSPVAIGHRIVHGGVIFHNATRITREIKAAIGSLSPLAPLHNPANLQGIEEMEALFPDVPQFAVFDTAFHSTIPTFAAEYPIPDQWTNMGIRRYGFHGISHSYCAGQAAKMLGKNISDINVITCHLGNGSSVTAVQRGLSVDTSMGFTPLEGLMMGTRSGTIDPSVVFYLLKEKKLPLEQIEHMLNHESGLKGVSGTDGDMRHVLKGVTLEDPDCTLALEMYVYSAARHIGAMAAALGQIDAIAFTAGIGENSPLVRGEIVKRLSHLGVAIDNAQNESCRGDLDISGEGSRIKVLVMHTQEELAIAKECLGMLANVPK